MNNHHVKQDMENRLEKVFYLAKYKVDDALCDQIWHEVLNYNKKIIRIKLWTFASMLFASVALLVPVLSNLYKNLSHSGFYEYSSLLLSDTGSVVSMWKEFALLLSESLPVMSILMTLTLALIFIVSLKSTIKQFIIRSQFAI